MKNIIYCDIKFGITKIYIVAKHIKDECIIRLHHILYSDNYIDIMKYLLLENFISDTFYKERMNDIKYNNYLFTHSTSYHDPEKYSIDISFI